MRIDKNKAVDYFRQAAQLNEPHAQYKIGKYYLQGGFDVLGNEGKPDA